MLKTFFIGICPILKHNKYFVVCDTNKYVAVNKGGSRTVSIEPSPNQHSKNFAFLLIFFHYFYMIEENEVLFLINDCYFSYPSSYLGG